MQLTNLTYVLSAWSIRCMLESCKYFQPRHGRLVHRSSCEKCLCVKECNKYRSITGWFHRCIERWIVKYFYFAKACLPLVWAKHSVSRYGGNTDKSVMEATFKDRSTVLCVTGTEIWLRLQRDLPGSHNSKARRALASGEAWSSSSAMSLRTQILSIFFCFPQAQVYPQTPKFFWHLQMFLWWWQVAAVATELSCSHYIV